MHRNKHWDWYVFPLPLATMTIWFSPESKGIIGNVPILTAPIFLYLWHHCLWLWFFIFTRLSELLQLCLWLQLPQGKSQNLFQISRERICWAARTLGPSKQHVPEAISDFISFWALVGENFDLPTWQVMSLFVKRTTKRYFGVLYLFLSWVTRRFRAK